MAKIQLPPKTDDKPMAMAKETPNVVEKKIRDVINKGGSTTKRPSAEQDDFFKNFNVRILQSELETINELRGKRPKGRGQKRLGISLHDWIVEAIQDKIEAERRKFKV